MADMLQNYVDGKFVDAADGTGFDVFNPATGEVIATAPDSKQADVDAAVERGASDVRRRHVVAADHRARARTDPAARRRHRPPRAGAPGADGVARLRQADRRGPRGHRRGRVHVRVLRRLGHEDLRRHPAGGSRRDVARREGAHGRRGRDHAVELPDDDGRAEGGAGDRGRMHGDPEARGADAAHRARDPEDPGGGRPAGRRPERAHRVRRDVRRAAHLAPERRQGRVHRLEGRRQDHHADRRGHAEARHARARRQVAEHRVRRCGVRRGDPGKRERHLLEPGRDLLGGLARVRRARDLRRRAERAGRTTRRP